MSDHVIFSKADTHLHTTYSDGSATPEALVDYIAIHTDLSVIAITDHDTASGAFVAQSYARSRNIDLEVIIGQEVTTDEGDIIGLFLNATLPQYATAMEAILAIQAQGGLAIAAHPFSYWSTATLMHGIGPQICELPLDGVEVRNGFPTNVISNPLTRWINRRHGKSHSELGGSDSHVPFTAGQAFTWFPGRTAADLHLAIYEKQTRAGGSLWTPKSLAQMAPILIKSGLPSSPVEQLGTDETLAVVPIETKQR